MDGLLTALSEAGGGAKSAAGVPSCSCSCCRSAVVGQDACAPRFVTDREAHRIARGTAVLSGTPRAIFAAKVPDFQMSRQC